MTNNKENQLLNYFKKISTLSVLELPDEVKLSRPAINLLKWINSSPGSGVVDIARGLHLSPPTISVGIQRLVNEGWLERRYDSGDRRMQKIFLTKKSLDFLAGLRAYQMNFFKEFLSSLTEEEQSELLILLEKVFKGMDHQKEKTST
jgi:DNA-binding MarR family transcriptional regulator